MKAIKIRFRFQDHREDLKFILNQFKKANFCELIDICRMLGELYISAIYGPIKREWVLLRNVSAYKTLSLCTFLTCRRPSESSSYCN